MPRESDLPVLHLERAWMRVREQHAALAERREPIEKRCGARLKNDARARIAFDGHDVESKLAAPVIDRVPVERALDRAEFRPEPLERLREIEPIELGVAARNEVEPELIIELEVEERAVHVKEHGIDAGPVDGRRVRHPRMISKARRPLPPCC